MNRDQFQKWIDEYVNDSYIPYIQCNDKEHALSYINVLERPSAPFFISIIIKKMAIIFHLFYYY